MNAVSLPQAAEPLLLSLSVAFTQPTFQRFLVLCVGAILSGDRQTVTHLLGTIRPLARGHFSSFHRVFSRAAWALCPLGRVLAAAVIARLDADRPVVVSVDDTTAQHRGKRVYGKGCHHDAVRSAHKHVVYRWGHRWVVLAVSVKFAFASRPWALPVLAALYKPRDLNRQEGRGHKTALDLARQLMGLLLRWFPDRRFVLLGDGGYASHELAAFAHRHRPRLTLVSRFHPDANLYAKPAPRRPGQPGRPRVKGAKRPAPAAVVRQRRPKLATVRWYGGGTRRVGLVSDTGQWYKSGVGLVPVRWVYVRDRQGTHRDEYFFTTDPDLPAERIVSWYTERWSIETTFQEMRAHLGFETTRQRTAPSVLRMAPCLLGLFSVVCLIYAEHVRLKRVRCGRTAWYRKAEPTFSDAIVAVRRLFWLETVFKVPSHSEAFAKLPADLRQLLLDRLTGAT